MVGDREAVCLVASALEQLQLGGAVVEHERRGASGEEDLLDALGQRDHHDTALAKAAQRLQTGGELAFAAVDHDEVGQRGEAGVVLGVVRGEVGLALELREAPAEHLGHRGEVVGAVGFQLAGC